MGQEASKLGGRSGSRKSQSGYDSPDYESYTDGSSKIARKPLATKRAYQKQTRGSPRKGGGGRNGNRIAAAPSPEDVASSSGGLGSNDSKGTVSTHIPDVSITVNLAMADLMAYLQVVANNSNDLPLTRRDDPEGAKPVSTLTNEEYAKKSAAFVPADVRMIGGVFAKYGRVWDLPTSEEYDATDGAQEPGRSYGGACCNAMLKVLYDAANEAAEDTAQDSAAASKALFDDDDDDAALAKPVEMVRERTFESLVLGDAVSPTTITWADLLRKMKAEVAEIGYAQAPTVTASRRFDVNKPFSLIPHNFDPKTGTKRSLLIGCNYTNVTGAELKASHDDVRSMKDYIVNVHGFPESKGLMTVLMDDDKHQPPTHVNITEAFKRLSEQSKPGDAVFVHFSGHGGRILDAAINDDVESYDEAFAPCDYQQSGLIRDTLIFKTMLAPMRYGVTVTVLIDTCDTGMMLDLPYSWTTKGDKTDSLAKLTWNEDFSFVRFLKVVKTLYEASTFTQLGKTVGTVLQHQREDGTFDEGDTTLGNSTSIVSETDGDTAKTPVETARLSILSTLAANIAACTSPTSSPEKAVSGHKKKTVGAGDVSMSGSTVCSRPAAQNILEQVMSCALGQDGNESDDDTYRRDVEQVTSCEETIDTMETEEYEEEERWSRNRRQAV